MKKVFTALLTTLGLSSGAQAAAPAQTIDPKGLRFSMPTVAADDIQFAVPTKETFEGAPQFHEDEWCQLEFFQKGQLSEIQRLLSEYKVFEKQNRTEHGWNQTYARRLRRTAFLKGSSELGALAQALQAKLLPAPILTTSSRPLGQVKDGFTLGLPGSVILYGLNGAEGVTVLAAIVERGGDDSRLANAFVTLSNEYQLILVDWRAQQVLVSASGSGQIDVWRP
jgi:hypothetical protein